MVNDNIVTVIDSLSNYTQFVPCTSHITAPELAQVVLAIVVAKHGMLSKLIPNQNPHFTSHFLCKLISILGCEHVLSTAYHPQSNEQTKYLHSSVEQVLSCFANLTQTDWDVLLPADKFALNSTYLASIGHIPAFVLYDHEPVLLFEHAICSFVDATVASVADCI